jgi:hypothetical protein
LIEDYENERNLRFRLKKKTLFKQILEGATKFIKRMDEEWHPNNSILLKKALDYLNATKNHSSLTGELNETVAKEKKDKEGRTQLQ